MSVHVSARDPVLMGAVQATLILPSTVGLLFLGKLVFVSVTMFVHLNLQEYKFQMVMKPLAANQIIIN